MKTVKIDFSGFWPDFNKEYNYIVSILRRRYNVIISDSPDYIFYSVFSNDYLKFDGIRIFYTGECISPDFNLCDYAMGFDWISNGDRYVRLPLYVMYDLYKGRDINCIEEKIKAEKEFCSFVYSNANGAIYRTELFKAINKYRTVSSGGKYMNNIGEPVADKLLFESKHKFSIACENGSYLGYTTEKILHSFAAYTVPIYWGNPIVGNEFNEEAFINCHRYKSIDDVVEYIKYVDNNEEEYVRMLKAPIFKEGFEPVDQLKSAADFLYKIFDVPYKDAYRRNQSYWGMKYETAMKKHKIF